MNMFNNLPLKKYFSAVCLIVCTILFLFNFWLFWPGYITHDWAYVMTNFNLNNHQPIMYALILKKISKLWGYHIYVPLLFNLIPFYLGICIIILGCWKRFQSQWCWLGLLPLLVGNIFFNNILLHSSFSSPMFVFLLWAIVLYQILVGITYKNLVGAGVAFLFALLSRHNAIIQVYPVFFIYSYFIVQKMKPTFRLLKYCGILLLFACLTLTIAYSVPQVLKKGEAYPSTHIFLHQIAGACVPNQDENCFKAEWYEDGKSFADVQKEYLTDALNADRMSRHWFPEHPFKHANLEDIHTIWLKAIVKYPYDYLLHISRFIGKMWLSDTQKNVQLTDDKHCVTKKDCEWLTKSFSEKELFYKSTPAKIAIYNFLKKGLPTIKTIFFVCLNFILLIVAGILFIRRRNVALLYCLASSIAGVASSIIFCVFSPVTDSRYIYPVIVSTLMALGGGILYFCDKRLELQFISESINIRDSIRKYKKYLLILFIVLLSCAVLLKEKSPLVSRVDVYSAYKSKPIFLVHQNQTSRPLPEAKWMLSGGNRGFVVHQNGKKMNFTIFAFQNADIKISLRGPDVRDDSGKRLEKWVKYTDFTIDDKKILSEPVKVWHDKPYRYTLKAKKNHLYKIKLKMRKG